MFKNFLKYHSIRHLIRLFFIGSVLFGLFFGLIWHWSIVKKRSDSTELVRIWSGDPHADSLLAVLNLVPVNLDEQGRWREFSMTFKQMLFLQDRGVDLALIVKLENPVIIPRTYRPYDEVITRLRRQVEPNPTAMLVQIGTTAWKKQPIWALKIADPAAAPDNPDLLITAGYHGLEAVGVRVCLGMIEAIIGTTNTNFFARNWLNKVNFWFVPVVNPDGYDLVVKGEVPFPWWRKNLRDNNQNQQFNPEFDGVDLNRNFDYQWILGGSAEPGDWQYRGPLPFSEPEVQAIRDLVTSQRFIAGLTLHSHGENVLYPMARSNLVAELAQKIALAFEKEGGGNYEIMPLNRFSGQSSNWLFFQQHVLEYVLELSNMDFPEDKVVQRLTRQALEALNILIDAIPTIGNGDQLTENCMTKILLTQDK